MPKTDKRAVCGAPYFGFEVMRCQLPAGHAGWHYRGGLHWGVNVAIPASYQVELQKAATLKEG